MKTKRSFFSVLMAVAMSFLLAACSCGDPTVTPTPQEVTLSKTTATLLVGESLDLTASVKLSDETTNTDVAWKSSDSTVATVTDGKVTAVKVGSATITATSNVDSSKSASCVITVTQTPSIALSRTTLDMIIGNEETLTATVTFADGTSSSDVSWSSNTNAVATVSDGGVVKAISNGTAIITATSTSDNTIKGTCSVTVSYEPKIELTPKTVSLMVGGTTTLTATVRLANGTTNSRVSWKSSDDNIATVSGGVVTAVARGTAIITATSQDITTLNETSTISVSSQPVINISAEQKILGIGREFTLTATATLADGTTDTIDWSSSAAEVATVSTNGVVKGISAGTATITATAHTLPSLSKTCIVTVDNSGITVTPTTVTMIQGDAPITLVSEVLLTDGTTNSDVAWSITSGDSVTVADGVVTAVKSGTTIIKVTSVDDSSLTTNCTVTVRAPQRVTLSRQEALMIMGSGEVRLNAMAIYEQGFMSDKISWETSDASKVSVNNGILQPVAVGSATITAKVPNGTGFMQATCVVDVLADVTGIESYTEGGLTLTLRNATVNDILCYSVKAENKSITSATIPNSKNKAPVTIIENEGFKDCTTLTTFTLGNNVVEIGSNAFRNAKVNTALVLNPSTKMAEYAFAASNFTKVTIGEGTKVVPLGAFEAAKLNTVVFPRSLTEIKSYAFANCENLVTADLTNTALEMIGTERVGVKLGNSFFSCYKLTTIGTLPNTLKEIGFATFLKCPQLKTVSLGNDLRKIGAQAFMQCGRISSISIPESVRVVGEGAFNMWGSDQTINIAHQKTELPLGFHANWLGDGSKARVNYKA